jgi:hypothetical protein
MHINGTIDICVGWQNKNFLFEIKKDKKAKMKDSQIKFFAEWKGQITRVESAVEIINFLKWQSKTSDAITASPIGISAVAP